MKGKRKSRVQVEEGLFARRKAEKQKARDDDQRALETGQKTVEELRRENEHFTGLKVRLELDRALVARWPRRGSATCEGGAILHPWRGTPET